MAAAFRTYLFLAQLGGWCISTVKRRKISLKDLFSFSCEAEVIAHCIFGSRGATDFSYYRSSTMAETAVRPRPTFATYFTRHDTGGDDELLAAERARSAKRNRLPSLSGHHNYRSFQAMKEDPRTAAQFKRAPSATPHRQNHPLVDTISGVTAIGADFGAPPIDLPMNKARPLSARQPEEHAFSSSVVHRGGAYGGEDTVSPLPLADHGLDARYSPSAGRAPSAAMRRRSRSAGTLRLEEMARMKDGDDRRPRPPGSGRVTSARTRAMSARVSSARAQERISKWEESGEDDDDTESNYSTVPPLSLDRSLSMPPSIHSRSTPQSARPYSSTGRSQRRIDDLSEKYIWTSSTKRGMEDINWTKKLPDVDNETPDTVVEKMADPVSQRWQLHRYAAQPEKWQVMDSSWDRLQTRDPSLSKHTTNFISAAERSHQIPGYTGVIGKVKGDVDMPAEDFQALGTVRTEKPWRTDTARCGDIPGYTGCKLWSSSLPAHRHNHQPWQTTTARVHRVIPNEEGPSPFIRTGAFSRLITLVPPHNPHLKERNESAADRMQRLGAQEFNTVQPKWVITEPAVEVREKSGQWQKGAPSRAASPDLRSNDVRSALSTLQS